MISARGEVRNQFHHVIDIAPTILELAGIPEPSYVNGVAQTPMQGVSLAYTFDDADAADRHQTQYFEVFCNRGIYHQGWTAVTRTAPPGWWGRCRRSTKTSGSCTTPPPIGARPRTWPPSCPTSWPSCNGCG